MSSTARKQFNYIFNNLLVPMLLVTTFMYMKTMLKNFGNVCHSNHKLDTTLLRGARGANLAL